MPEARPQVLVVDDDFGNRLTITALLEQEGYVVDEADTATVARAAVETGQYDIILLDRHLGDVDGLSLVPQIRASLPGSKIVLVSGAIGPGVSCVDATFEKGSRFDALLETLRALFPGGRG